MHGAILVDPEDVHILEQPGWHVWWEPKSNTPYVVRSLPRGFGPRRAERLHRVIAGAHPGVEVDHKNGNGLDNRRANLRLCTHAENTRNAQKRKDNTSGHKGVSWNPRLQAWVAYVNHQGKRHHLGYFHEIQEAVEARRAKATELHGDFTRLE